MNYLDQTQSHRQVAIDSIPTLLHILTPNDAHRPSHDVSASDHPHHHQAQKTAVREQNFVLYKHNKRYNDDLVEQQPLHTIQQIYKKILTDT